MVSMNGNGGATATPRVIRGASVVHQALDKRQLACLSADVLEGTADYQPTRKELAQLFGVSGNYMTRRASSLLKSAVPSSRGATIHRSPFYPPAGAAVRAAGAEAGARRHGARRVH